MADKEKIIEGLQKIVTGLSQQADGHAIQSKIFAAQGFGKLADKYADTRMRKRGQESGARTGPGPLAGGRSGTRPKRGEMTSRSREKAVSGDTAFPSPQRHGGVRQHPPRSGEALSCVAHRQVF